MPVFRIGMTKDPVYLLVKASAVYRNEKQYGLMFHLRITTRSDSAIPKTNRYLSQPFPRRKLYQKVMKSDENSRLVSEQLGIDLEKNCNFAH
jgi:hypothetical protein